jgi:hypothetical protein
MSHTPLLSLSKQHVPFIAFSGLMHSGHPAGCSPIVMQPEIKITESARSAM